MDTTSDSLLSKKLSWYYILLALNSCFFATGNWYFLWRLYLTNQGIGIVDGLCFAAGFLMEIPSGAIADLYGRKRTMIASSILMGVGYALNGFALSGSMILTGYLIYSVGSAFYSGSDDALMYDELKKHNQEGMWKKVVTKKHIVMRIAALSSTIVGGLLFALNMRYPAILRGVFFLLMLIPLAFLPENYGRTDSDHIGIKRYLNQIKDGMRQILQPSLRPLLLLFIVIGSVLGTLYVSGVLRPLLLVRAGLGGESQSYVIGAAGITTVVFLWLYAKYLHLFTSKSMIWLTSIITLFTFTLLIVIPAQLSLPLLFLIQVVQGLFMPATSNIVNHEIASSHRATALSTLSLFQSVPYIIAAPLIGYYSDKN